MGATQWSYFVPYQPDINEALQQLRNEVFKQGVYEQSFRFDHREIESQIGAMLVLSRINR